ncbi:MAG: multicopper oxidase domain-containing protein [Alphaproteobacteria bacterium]|nr:multicopper oxidase domain-containing protein [Alphaproteobacteria bacterium]
MLKRRQLLTTGVGAAAALTLPWSMRRAYPFAQSRTNIQKFVNNLPGLGPAGANQIGQYLTLPTKSTTKFAGLTTDVYHLGVTQFSQQILYYPNAPQTKFWGYYDLASGDHKYLGGVIVANRGTPVLLNITNNLPGATLIPVDPTIMGSATQTVGGLPKNRIATHLHGGFTPWFSDGTPFQWFTPAGPNYVQGESFMNVPGTSPSQGTATYWYPMDQSARLVWYHDHAMGITRTNAYAGIASALLIIDKFETRLVDSGHLPDLVGIPLVIQDKSFVPSDIAMQDPTWQGLGEGNLWYPHVYEPTSVGGTGPNPSCMANPTGRWDYGPCAAPPAVLPGSSFYTLPTPASVVAEAFFDTILVNGGVYPVVTVPPQRVRFRLLNGSQARFYHLNLYQESSTAGEANTNKPGPAMYQVGTEGGFLPAVAVHRNGIPCPLLGPDTADPDGPFNLLLAPAERADVVIDFSGVSPGRSFILYNDAPAPFPGGDPRNDYFTGDPDQTAIGGAPTTLPGFGPNTRTVMKIGVAAGRGDSVKTSAWLAPLNALLRTNFLTGNQPSLLYNSGDPSVPRFPYTGPPKGATVRQLTLNEDFDEYGRLIQTLGTVSSISSDNQGLNTWGVPYTSSATETPKAGAIEVWQLFNLTGDTHPIHFHLVNVQIIQRQMFIGDPASGITLLGSPIPPDDNEIGWKDTVRMNPGEVTTVIMQLNLPSLPASMGNPLSPRTGGHEYVWHCHILEHEEHDMMRPLVVF